MRDFADARPHGLGHESGDDAIFRYGPEALRLILRVIGVVGAGDLGLVGKDENVAQAAKLLRYRRDEVVADQDVLVFFLHQLKARRQNNFHHVLARGQHGGAGAVRVIVLKTRSGCLGRIRYANRAVRPSRLPALWVNAGYAGERVRAVVGCRLELVPVVHAVIAFVLRVVRQRSGCGGPSVRSVVHVEGVLLVQERVKEEIRARAGAWGLARAVHVGDVVGPEACGPIVPAAGLGGVGQRQGWCHPIRRETFFVEVDSDVRNQGRPLHLNKQLRVVKGPGRGILDMTMDSAVLRRSGRDRGGVRSCVGRLTEFQEIVLASETLPALGPNPRRIDTARRSCRGAGEWPVRNRKIGAVRSGAIDRARYRKIGGQREGIVRVGQELANRGGSARRVTSCPARG